MANDLEALASMEYPGRVIIIGMTPDRETFVAYGLSGRSDPSKARRLVNNPDDFVSIDVTDPEQLKKGDPELLLYDAIRRVDDETIILSNGGQTRLIHDTLFFYATFSENRLPTDAILRRANQKPYLVRAKDGRLIDLTRFEPDSLSTPRISGVLRDDYAMMLIVKKSADGRPVPTFFRIDLKPGEASLLATYDGPNIEPIKSFQGGPRKLDIDGVPQDIADEIYNALGAFRVGAACMFMNKDYTVGITNLHGGK